MRHIQLFIIGIFLWITLVTFISTTKINWTKFRFEDSSYRSTCRSTNFTFIRDDVPDSLACSKMCYEHNKCLTVVYHPDNFKCIGCEVVEWQAITRLSGSLQFSSKVLDISIDCKDILEKNRLAKSGVYEIKPKSSGWISVFCDMTTDGGGWTVC
ncbi:uncharacterized protein LOC132738762 [Ruditapes philippinarum]|uniref:uncharacterized protein LOC132738762 n=1 Tax=Ruditapes philippinarum TaxID=129788 RepID=UPI00295BD5C8|nr:uncharacterized protein LOC132738762 [Ruditapes philippinarum]